MIHANRRLSEISRWCDAELLSAIVSESAAKELMSRYGTMQEILIHAFPQELEQVPGIGKIKVQQIQAVREISRRLYRFDANLPTVIRSPQDAFDRLADMQHLSVEQFRVIYLSTKNHIIAEDTVSQGTLNATVVTPREIFHGAVRRMAAAVILAHNHPSGDPVPSQEDLTFTKRLVDAGKVMDIAVLDHVIIGKGRYVSLKEKGVL